MDSLKRDGVTMTFRMMPGERRQLLHLAQRELDTLSDLIREALHDRYGVGELAASSMAATSAVSLRLNASELARGRRARSRRARPCAT